MQVFPPKSAYIENKPFADFKRKSCLTFLSDKVCQKFLDVGDEDQGAAAAAENWKCNIF